MPVFPVLCFLLLSGFLGCLGLFALAVTKVATPDGRGHSRGLFGGLAALLSLFLLCALGLTGLAATVAAIGLGSVAEWNPIEHIEISRTSPPLVSRLGPHEAHEAQESAVSARFTVRGDGGGELVELLHDLLDVDLADLGDGLTIRQHEVKGGEDFSVYEFRLPISEKELERFERDVRLELDGLRVQLPERVGIDFDGAD